MDVINETVRSIHTSLGVRNCSKRKKEKTVAAAGRKEGDTLKEMLEVLLVGRNSFLSH